MKKLFIVGILSLSFLSVNAQNLPKPSPSCEIEQQVGLTNLKLEYSRPSVKDRAIFGDLVAFDKVWRLGANAPTMLSSDKDLTIDGQTLKAGKYAVFAIPSEKEWTVVFNTDTEQWGAGNYDEKKNVVSTKVATQKNKAVESLSITFQELTTASGHLVIEWAETRVAIPFTMDTDKFAMENIATAIKEGKDLEKVYYNAASYVSEAKGDNKMALNYLDKSMEVKAYHANTFLKARILKEEGKDAEALKTAKEAHKLALAAESMGWADYIKGTIERWQK